MGYEKSLYIRGFQPQRQGRTGLVLGVVLALAIVAVNYFVFFRGSGLAEPTLDQRLAKPAEVREEPAESPSMAVPNALSVPAPSTRMVEGVLARGETAGQALARLGVAPASASAALAALSKHVDMRALRTGQKLASFGRRPGARFAQIAQ